MLSHDIAPGSTLMYNLHFQAKDLTEIAGKNSNVHILSLDVKNFEEFDSFAGKVTMRFNWSRLVKLNTIMQVTSIV